MWADHLRRCLIAGVNRAWKYNYYRDNHTEVTSRHFPLTLCPWGNPGSDTADESSRTNRSCTCPMLLPRLSSPSCSIPRVGNSEGSMPRTFPKLRRNCTTIRQSANTLPGRTRPWIRGISGRGCGGREKQKEWGKQFSRSRFNNTFQISNKILNFNSQQYLKLCEKLKLR